MLLWIVVLIQAIAILCLAASLKRQGEVIETLYEFVSKTHPYELYEFLNERRRKERENK